MSSTMRESKFWAEHVKGRAFGKWIRIESASTRLGISDCVALVDGVTSWVELKSKDTLEDGLGTTAIQRHFLDSWIEAGGTAYLLARVGREVLFLSGRGLPRVDTLDGWRTRALVAGTLGRFDWTAVRRIMSARVT